MTRWLGRDNQHQGMCQFDIGQLFPEIVKQFADGTIISRVSGFHGQHRISQKDDGRGRDLQIIVSTLKFLGQCQMGLADLEKHFNMNNAGLPAVQDSPHKDGKRVFSSFELIGSLRKYTCSHVSENVYNFHYSDEVIRSIEKVFHIDLNKRFRKRGDIRKFIASMKK